MRTGPAASRRTFLKHFPGGFHDETYLAWERDYKWEAHRLWVEHIGGKRAFKAKLDAGRHEEIASAAVRIESSRALLFSFEKMALRDAVVRSHKGAVSFADGLYDWLHGPGPEQERFERWIDVVAELPRKQTRVATWPVITVFGFIARPKVHCYLKPLATKRAAEVYGFDLEYSSRPSWDTYGSLLELCATVRRDQADLRPRDQIDVQSFLWVLGSDEYNFGDGPVAGRRRCPAGRVDHGSVSTRNAASTSLRSSKWASASVRTFAWSYNDPTNRQRTPPARAQARSLAVSPITHTSSGS